MEMLVVANPGSSGFPHSMQRSRLADDLRQQAHQFGQIDWLLRNGIGFRHRWLEHRRDYDNRNVGDLKIALLPF